MTSAKTISTNEELKNTAELLKEAAEEFSDHSCNDYSLPASEENKAIVIATLKFIEATGDYEDDWDEFAAKVREAKGEISFFDNWLMSYMADRCKTLAEEGAQLSDAEAEVVRGLFAFIDEVRGD